MSVEQKKFPVTPSISTIFTDKNSAIHNLYNHALKLLELQRQIKDAVPSPLSDQLTVANLANDTLTIHTTSAAWAARLRFRIPDMLKSLNEGEAGSSIKSIRIKVKPPDNPSPEREKNAGISSETASMLQNLADSISDPELRESLLRLSRNRRKHP